MREWLKGGCIPNDDGLKQELVGPRYSEAAGGILIERKQDMASRGLSSPDSADALALTFAAPVWTAQASGLAGPGDYQVQSEYNPFSDAALAGKPYPELAKKYCAPGWSRMRDPVGGWDPDAKEWMTPDAPVE
jgi:hypothetical protein